MNLLTDEIEELNYCKILLSKLKNVLTRNLILSNFNKNKDKFQKQNKDIKITDVDGDHYLAYGSDGCHLSFSIINDYNLFLSQNLDNYDKIRSEFNSKILMLNAKYEELVKDVENNSYELEEWL